MIEPTELVNEALEIITPMLTAGGEALAKGVFLDLWTMVKSIFKKKDEVQLLEKFQQEPNNANTRGKIEYILESELKHNQDLIPTFRDLLNSVKKSEEYKVYVNQTGNNNISITGKIHSSTININKKS